MRTRKTMGQARAQDEEQIHSQEAICEEELPQQEAIQDCVGDS